MKLSKVTVYGVFSDYRGYRKGEIEAEPLTRELIRHIRDSEYFFDGEVRLSFSDGTVKYVSFTERDIMTLNNLLEVLEA